MHKHSLFHLLTGPSTVALDKTAALSCGKKRRRWKITVKINKAILCWVSRSGYLLLGARFDSARASGRLCMLLDILLCLANPSLWALWSWWTVSARFRITGEIQPHCDIIHRPVRPKSSTFQATSEFFTLGRVRMHWHSSGIEYGSNPER